MRTWTTFSIYSCVLPFLGIRDVTVVFVSRKWT